VAEYYLSQIEPAVEDLVTIEQARLQCHADVIDIEDDWFLQKIKAGTRKIEDFTHRSLGRGQVWSLVYDRAPMVLSLPRSPLIAIRSIISKNEIVSSNLYEVMSGIPSRVFLDLSLSGEPIQVIYETGYEVGRVPQPLIDAVLLWVSWSYENRAGETDIPAAFYNLISPYKLCI